jgi:hypothetical protein
MELIHDWKSFQNVFYPHQRKSSVLDGDPDGPAYFIVDQDRILAAYSEREDLSDWVGASVEEVEQHLGHRTLLMFPRTELDRWMVSARHGPNYYHQVESLREWAVDHLAEPRDVSNSRAVEHALNECVRFMGRQNFLLEALHGWWRRLLPQTYGVILRLRDGEDYRDFAWLVQRGELKSFFRPDLSFLGQKRSLEWNEVLRYLEDTHHARFIGISTEGELWNNWCRMGSSPFKEVHRAMKKSRFSIHPRSFVFRAMVWIKSFSA